MLVRRVWSLVAEGLMQAGFFSARSFWHSVCWHLRLECKRECKSPLPGLGGGLAHVLLPDTLNMSAIFI